MSLYIQSYVALLLCYYTIHQERFTSIYKVCYCLNFYQLFRKCSKLYLPMNIRWFQALYNTLTRTWSYWTRGGEGPTSFFYGRFNKYFMSSNYMLVACYRQMWISTNSKVVSGEKSRHKMNAMKYFFIYRLIDRIIYDNVAAWRGERILHGE